jgi:transporter family protein
MMRLSFQGWALLSALFAGLTAILAKKGVENVPSNLAVAVRVAVVLAFACAIAVATRQNKLSSLNSRAWLFLVLSGIATGASWLCYFRALQLGPVSKVAPIDKLSFVIAMTLGFLLLGERPSANLLYGAILIVIGVLLTLR